MDIDKLDKFMILEREKCPWASTQSAIDMLQELQNEIFELREELIRQTINSQNIAEELADVYSDALLLMNIAERDKIIVSKQDIIDRALAKKFRRKGWLMEGKELTKEEASKYWYRAKDLEKINQK